MTTKNIKIDFSKREAVLKISEDWFDLGGGLYAAKVGKEASKAFFTSKRAAGRVVKKGAKALVIEAPKMIKGTDKSGEEYEHLICTPVCVFDISQTEELVKEGA